MKHTKHMHQFVDNFITALLNHQWALKTAGIVFHF